MGAMRCSGKEAVTERGPVVQEPSVKIHFVITASSLAIPNSTHDAVPHLELLCERAFHTVSISWATVKSSSHFIQ